LTANISGNDEDNDII